MNPFPYTTDPHADERWREYAAKMNRLFINTGHPLPVALAMAVPFEIHRLVEKGGPDEADHAEITRFGDELAGHGDNLLYRGEKKGDSAKLFAGLARAIAVMAFFPGGIKVFGNHYEAIVRKAKAINGNAPEGV